MCVTKLIQILLDLFIFQCFRPDIVSRVVYGTAAKYCWVDESQTQMSWHPFVSQQENQIYFIRSTSAAASDGQMKSAEFLISIFFVVYKKKAFSGDSKI